jgi:hypothetical protein
MTNLIFEVKITSTGLSEPFHQNVEPKLNTTKPYSVRGYINEGNEDLTTWQCIVAVDDENLSAFRNYAGYIEDE